MSQINEIIDYRNYLEGELNNKKFDYENLIHIAEITPYSPIKDSAKYFFKALPHSPDMVEISVVNDSLVYKKYNTQEEIDWEQKQFETETSRIKEKYNLRDTLVVIPGEEDQVAIFTKDNKLFDYIYESFLFRIERYIGNKLIETKYIKIYISYGC